MQSQYLWLGIIVVGLIVIAFVFAWRQLGTLSWLRTQEQMAYEEKRYFRWRSYRRLFGCLLLLALAVQLGGLYSFGYLERLDQLQAAGPAAKEAGRQLNQDEKAFMWSALSYVAWIALVIFVLMIVAFIDTMATRRYGMTQRKRIRDDRQAMLARQLPLLRRERNGQG